jgi:hypothetical protein
VPAISDTTDVLAGIEASKAEAWKMYSDRLSDLSGAEYDDAEPECWAELQLELRRLERRWKILRRVPG